MTVYKDVEQVLKLPSALKPGDVVCDYPVSGARHTVRRVIPPEDESRDAHGDARVLFKGWQDYVPMMGVFPGGRRNFLTVEVPGGSDY